MTSLLLPTDARLAFFRPALAHKQAFFRMLRDFKDAGERHWQDSVTPWGYKYWLRLMERHAQGLDLGPENTPYEVYYLMDDEQTVLVGVFTLRMSLTPKLMVEGGHIGYSITPSLRRRGYATYGLAQMLPIAAAHGICHVLVTCDDANTASARVIEHNGGVLENILPSPFRPGVPVRRYWIDLPRPQ